MVDITSAISDILALSLGTVGTTDVTLGLAMTFAIVASLAIYLYRRVARRA